MKGGRHTPFFNNYRPQFYFRTTDVTGNTEVVDAEMCMPGDNAKIKVMLITPIAMDERPPLRDSRGRSHRGCGCGREDPEVTAYVVGAAVEGRTASPRYLLPS